MRKTNDPAKMAIVTIKITLWKKGGLQKLVAKSFRFTIVVTDTCTVDI